jgi:UDP-3-O-[3-hydroxymyristoyl] glucosamine N-acyltransferase
MSSWKKVGGINKLDKMNFLNVNSIVTDKLTLREAYTGQFDVCGNATVSNKLSVDGDVSLNSGIYIKGKLVVEGGLDFSGNIVGKSSITLYDKLYLGSDLSASYFYGDGSGIGINIKKPMAALDICGNYVETLNVFSNQTTNRNIIARNVNRCGISVYTSDTSSNIYFFNDSSINTTNFDGRIQYEKGGIMIIDVSDNTKILSNVSISNREDTAHILDETAIIYDICNNTYAYNVYDVSSANTGYALSLVSSDNSSNTFMNLIAPNNIGLSVGGGAYPNDTERSMGTFGIIDASSNYIPTQTIVSGSSNIKYKTTLGINTHAPRIDNYVVDINGPVHMTNGEVTNVSSNTFEIKNMLFDRSNSDYGIAFGSPYNITNIGVSDASYLQQILYTHDGGKTWSPSKISDNFTGSHSIAFENNSRILYSGYVYDQSYSIIAGDTGYKFYSNDGGKKWNNINFENEINNTFTGVYLNKNSYNDDKRVILTYGSSFVYFDVSFSTFDSSMAGQDSYYITDSSINKVDVSNSVANVHGYDNYIYLVGSGISKYDISNLQYVVDSSHSLPSGYYNSVYAYDNNYVLAVGNYIISYTNNGGTTWTDISKNAYCDIPIETSIFKSVYMYDASYAIAVGNKGNIIYSTDSGANWTTASGEIVNTSGNGSRIVNTDYNLNSVAIMDKNSFIVSNVIDTYSYDSSTDYSLGKTNLMYCFLPNMINRKNNYLLDVCGNMKLYGDLYFGDGGNIISNSTSFALLNETVETIFFGNDASAVYIGQSNKGNVFVQNSLDVSQNLYVRRDFRVDGNIYSSKDITFDGPITMSNVMTITNSDVSTSSTTGALIVSGGIGVSGNVYVGSRLDVSGNADISGNLTVRTSGIATIANTTASTSASIGALVIKGGVGIAKNLYIDGSVNINNLTASTSSTSGALTISGGAGVDGNVYVGNKLDVSGNADISGNLTVRNSGIVTIENITASTSASIGAFIVNGGVGISKNVHLDGSLNVAGITAITNSTSTSSTSTGALVVSGGVGIQGGLNVASIVNFTNATDGGSNGAAALSVRYGGFYAEKSAYIRGNLTNAGIATFSNSAAASSATSGALIVTGGAGISGNVYVGGNILDVLGNADISGNLTVRNTGIVTIANTTISSDSGSGALKVSGGVGITKNINIGGMANITGVTSITSGNSSTSTGTGALKVTGGVGITENINIGGNSNVSGNISITSGTTSTSTGTGALVVSGGVGIAENAYIGGTANIGGRANISGILEVNNSVTITGNASIQNNINIDGNANITGNAIIGGTASIIGITTINDTTGSSSTTSGALVVSGGVGIAGAVYIGTNANIDGTADIGGAANIGGNTTINSNTGSSSYSNGALVVKGGIGIAGSAYINENVNIGGITMINSTTGSTSSVSGALIIKGGVGIAGSAYIGGTANIGGRANISGILEVNNGVTITGNAYIQRNINLDGNAIITGNANISGIANISSGNVSGNTTSGALVVSGGVGIGGNINIGGTANIEGVTTITNTTVPTSTGGSGALKVSGGIVVAGSSYFGNYVNAVTFNATSDYRVKKEVTKLNGLFSVDKLEPVFYYNSILKNNDIGFIAHKVQEIYPYLVNGEKDGENYQSLNYNGIIGILVHEIQELKKTVGEMKQKLDTI